MKTQSFLPIYDQETKRILGLIQLPYAKTFDGTETTHCVDYPNTPTAANTVNVVKVEPYAGKGGNSTRDVNDWYMAAVFTHEEIRTNQYKGFARFQSIEDNSPSAEHRSTVAVPNQLTTSRGTIMEGLMRSFKGVADNELKPINTVLPVVSGTLTSMSTLSTTNGTWTSTPAPTYTYEWLLDGVVEAGQTTAMYVVPAGSSGKTVASRVTATNGDYSTTVQSANVTITA